jgi:hypothetical protein
MKRSSARHRERGLAAGLRLDHLSPRIGAQCPARSPPHPRVRLRTSGALDRLPGIPAPWRGTGATESDRGSVTPPACPPGLSPARRSLLDSRYAGRGRAAIPGFQSSRLRLIPAIRPDPLKIPSASAVHACLRCRGAQMRQRADQVRQDIVPSHRIWSLSTVQSSCLTESGPRSSNGQHCVTDIPRSARLAGASQPGACPRATAQPLRPRRPCPACGWRGSP